MFAKASMARFAERYSAHGLVLLRTAPGDKHPRYPGWNRPENATSPKFWVSHPRHGIATLLEPSGIVSVDVDDEALAEPLMQHFGVDLRELRKNGPCIVGRHYRLMYRLPDVPLKHRSVKWPKEKNPRFSSVILEFRAGFISDTLPPTIHPGTGMPYRWENPPRNGFPRLPARLLELWMDWPEFSRETLAFCPWALPPNRTPLDQPTPRQPRGTSVIDLYNASHDSATILAEHGYVRKGKRFASPGTEHAAGIVLTESGRIFCHHQGDPLSSEHAHDAFDLYRILQHGGDYRAAVKGAAVLLGLDRRKRTA